MVTDYIVKSMLLPAYRVAKSALRAKSKFMLLRNQGNRVATIHLIACVAWQAPR